MLTIIIIPDRSTNPVSFDCLTLSDGSAVNLRCSHPNPPIAEEFWGIWMSQQRIDAEEAPWEGMGVPSWWE
jgi:hypothetical protein